MDRGAWFQSDEAFATCLLLLFVDAFGEFGKETQEHDGELGTSCLQWTPLTIDAEIHEELGHESSPRAFTKLMTAIQLLTTDDFYVSEPSFVEGCCGLAGDQISDQHFIMPTAEDVAWAIIESGIIGSVAKGQEPRPFSDAIKTYIRKALEDEGFSSPAYMGLEDQPPPDFSDDPEMFAGVWSVQKSRRDDLKRSATDKAEKLLEQLRILPLKNGSTKSLVAELRQSLANHIV